LFVNFIFVLCIVRYDAVHPHKFVCKALTFVCSLVYSTFQGRSYNYTFFNTRRIPGLLWLRPLFSTVADTMFFYSIFFSFLFFPFLFFLHETFFTCKKEPTQHSAPTVLVEIITSNYHSSTLICFPFLQKVGRVTNGCSDRKKK
jgi:hypothetical protein